MKKALTALVGVALLRFVAVAEPISDGPIEPGEWNSKYREAYAYAVANHMPFIAIVSKYPSQCHMCAQFHDKWTCDEFLEWAKARGPIMGAFYTKTPDGTDGSWVDWVAGKMGSPGSISGFPMIRIYWDKGNGEVVWDRFMGRQSAIGDVDGDGVKGTVKDFIARLEETMGDWESVSYSGGEFACGSDVDGDRLEAESATTNVMLRLVRSEKAADAAAENTLSVKYPTRAVTSVNVSWRAGEAEKTVNLPITTAGLQGGDAITLLLVDEEGVERGTNHVWYVEKAVSAANPYWIGEKKDLGFGEWTMDLDAATNLVAKSEGQAYTMVLLEGALWCGDCKNVEGSFLSATNSVGENVFEKWARDNKVALVAIDCPMFTNKTEYARPTLLSREDVRGNGVSGRGYLTRKMVDDDTAAAILERNHQLTTKNTYEGGFHRPEDSNAYRTGVPFFVILRKDGSVAARLTRWAAVSTTALDSGNFDAFYSRFEEMLAMAAESGEHAEAGEIENGYPGAGAAAFKASGGSANGELSHCDMRDVFRLDGVGGNALQKVTVSGASDAQVKVSFLTNALGKAVQVGDAATGKLSAGVSLEYMFTEAGEYYVLVEGSSVAASEWAVENKTPGNFVQYSISGEVVLVPQEVAAVADSSSGSVVIRLEKGSLYRIDGLDEASVNGSLAPAGETPRFFTALVSGDVALPTLGGEVSYQAWKPCTVGFDAAERTVDENAGNVEIPISRSGGTSGRVTVEVSLDEMATAHADSEGTPRYIPFAPVTVTWEDGDSFSTNVVVSLLDDEQFDGPGKVVLNLAVTSDVNGDTAVSNGVFTLSVRDNDKSAPGVVSFVETGTVYCKESTGATVHAVRTVTSDGDVSVSVATTAGKLAEGAVSWSHRDMQEKPIALTGLAAGKTATLTLTAAEGGVIVPRSGRTLKVVAVSNDGPEFDQASETLELTRYVAVSHLAEVDSQTFPSGSELVFTKKSGTLPPGLTAKWNGEGAMLIAGTPSRAGEWTAVYQVAYRSGGKTVPGLVTEITFRVSDPASAGTGGEAAANPAVATTRTFKDLMVLCGGELKGLLQVTIPPTGRASAKYATTGGTITFSSKSWSGIDSDGALSATLPGVGAAGTGWTLGLTANADGSVAMQLSGPGGFEAEVSSDGRAWSAENRATDYEGYYTVTLPETSLDEETEGLAPTGAGYMTVKLQGDSDLKKGNARWAGMLPNGTSVSGSAVLCDGEYAASMPVFKWSSRDTLSGVAAISRNAVKLRTENAIYEVVTAPSSCPEMLWRHVEAEESKASFQAALGVHGCLYDKGENLETCCGEFFDGKTDMWLVAEGEDSVSSVKVGEDSLTLDKTAGKNALSATLGFNRSTGVASGSLKRGGKTVQWKGVAIVGLGGCSACSAGAGDTSYPLVNGALYYSETIQYPAKGIQRKATVKRGAKVKIDVNASFTETLDE